MYFPQEINFAFLFGKKDIFLRGNEYFKFCKVVCFSLVHFVFDKTDRRVVEKTYIPWFCLVFFLCIMICWQIMFLFFLVLFCKCVFLTCIYFCVPNVMQHFKCTCILIWSLALLRRVRGSNSFVFLFIAC